MSLKVRCSQCQKKISVDEAFAGSMCRCPYCKMIVRVPELPVGVSGPGGRPSRPGSRPERPDAPRSKTVVGSGLKHVTGSRPLVETPARSSRPSGPTIIEKPGVPRVPEEPSPSHRPPPSPAPERKTELIESTPVDESRLTAEQIAAIPMADPVFLQGMVSLVLIGVLVVVGTASVYLGVRVFSSPSETDDNAAYLPGQEPEKPEELPNPFLVGEGGPKVCGTVAIHPPVGYLIDGGEAMGDLYLYARDALRASVLSLGSNNSFFVIVAGETQTLHVGKKAFRGGAAGEKILRSLLYSNYDEDSEKALVEIGGVSDLPAAVKKALSLKPRTLVMFVRNTEIPDPAGLGKALADARVRLVLTAFGYEYEKQKEDYEAMVRAAGGESRLILYEADQRLQAYHEESNLPE